MKTKYIILAKTLLSSFPHQRRGNLRYLDISTTMTNYRSNYKRKRWIDVCIEEAKKSPLMSLHGAVLILSNGEVLKGP